jgi:hypothetical protein
MLGLCVSNVRTLGTFPVQHPHHHVTFHIPDRGPAVVTLRSDVYMSHNCIQHCYQHCQHSYTYCYQPRHGSSYQAKQDRLNRCTVVCEAACCCEGNVEVGEVNEGGSRQENKHLCVQEWGDQWEAYDPQKVRKCLKTCRYKEVAILLQTVIRAKCHFLHLITQYRGKWIRPHI